MDQSKGSLRRELGFFMTVAIVVGQMVGSGIYMTPQGLAELANPRAAILAMFITGMGSLFLALSFSRLSNRGAVTGSAVVYTQQAFGDMPAFWVGWSYWCGCWTANGAIAVAAVNYASYFFPVLATNRVMQLIAVLAIIWFYTLLNIKGVKAAGAFNLALTIIKLLPILIFLIIAFLNFDAANLNTVSRPEVSGLQVLPAAVAYCLWSYLGFEGATITAGEVKDRSYVSKATVLSTFFVMMLYIVLIALAAGTMTQAELAASPSPLADSMRSITGGYWAGAFISVGGSLSAFGCIGAWILSAGRISFSLAELKLLPQVFGTIDKNSGAPIGSLLINGILMTIVMIFGILNATGNVYNFLVMLSVMSFLVFYLFGAASDLYLSGKEIKAFGFMNFIKASVISLIAFVYSVYTIYGSGAEYVLYGFLLLVVGIPFYVYVKLKDEAKA